MRKQESTCYERFLCSEAGMPFEEAPHVSADNVCKPKVKRSCGETFDLNYVCEKCSKCLRNLFLESFPKEAADVKAAEAALKITRAKMAATKAFPYSVWWSRLETLLKARKALYAAAVDYYGHGQVLDVLDPCEDMHNVCDREQKFLSTALGKDLLVTWKHWSHYGLKAMELPAREVYSTKSIPADEL